MQKQIYIVNTGLANLASVKAAFRRLGKQPEITENTSVIRDADYVVLPGVGNFGPAVKTLEIKNQISDIQDRVSEKRPTLAVCLGFQLLAQSSDEDKDVKGLGVITSKVTKMKIAQPIPQIGWNQIEVDDKCSLLESGYFYFANSYAYSEIDDSWAKAYYTYEKRYIAACEKGSILACQFHPELSGSDGEDLLKNWLEKGASS